MKNKLPILALFIAALLFTGCGTPRSTQAITQAATYVATSIALQESPEVRPYLTGITVVICAAATGTNSAPDILISDIERQPGKNVPAAILVNSLLAIWLSYVDANDPDAQAALQGICTGLNFALVSNAPSKALGSPKAYPHVKVK